MSVYDRYVEDGTGTNEDLVRLAAEFRWERPYPSESDKANIAAREEMADALSRETLEAAEQDPTRWDALRFSSPAAHTGAPARRAESTAKSNTATARSSESHAR